MEATLLQKGLNRTIAFSLGDVQHFFRSFTQDNVPKLSDALYVVGLAVVVEHKREVIGGHRLRVSFLAILTPVAIVLVDDPLLAGLTC